VGAVERWLHNTRGLIVLLLAVATGVVLLAIDPGDGYPHGVGTAAGSVVTTTVPGATTTARPGTGATTTTAVRPTLQEGSTGPEVVTLQQRLNTLGYNVGTADGQFGPSTKAQVVAFQQAHGLTANGIVDSATWAALDKATPK
jgi:peptidoglycan hydrolase-like protein with peptidoglycan-binding domain